ncbi:MAG: hypothetical protein KJ042_04330 [Deltaproteobacteria bacterium]|nr:hypothetical protein [Deltaproteobacteria bacterium]
MRDAARYTLWSMTVAAFLVVSLGTGCAIKNQKGEEIFAVQVKTGPGGAEEPAESESSPAATPAPEASAPEATPNPTSTPSSEPAKSPEAAEEPAASTAKTPWWKKPSVEVKDLDADDSSPGESQAGTQAEKKPATPHGDFEETDLAPDDPAEEPIPEPTPPPPAPEKKEAQVDRHLQPVTHEQWMETYKKQTAPAVKPDRRASMGNVQKAIESGYGTTYVTHLENAINVDKSNGYAYYFLARGRFEKGDWKGSKGFADKSIQMLGEDPKFRSKARVLYAKVLANLGEKDAAAAQAKAALADDSENTEAKILSMKLN